MGYQWLRRMPYLSKTRHGIYRYRRTIPPVLREAAGQREFVRSLETREPQEAKKLWAVVNLEFERYISDLETLANIPTNEAPVDVQQRIGAEFLKKHRLSSIPLAELREQHKLHEDHLGPSEFEKRSALVEELLGISMDDVLRESKRFQVVQRLVPLLVQCHLQATSSVMPSGTILRRRALTSVTPLAAPLETLRC